MYHIGNATVQYTNRQWQTTADNHTATFPRGEEGKQAAVANAVAIVTSQKNKKREYIIQWRDVPVCSCDDYQFEKAPRIGKHQVKTCKHILAVMLLKNIGRFQIKITWNK